MSAPAIYSVFNRHGRLLAREIRAEDIQTVSQYLANDTKDRVYYWAPGMAETPVDPKPQEARP